MRRVQRSWFAKKRSVVLHLADLVRVAVEVPVRLAVDDGRL